MKTNKQTKNPAEYAQNVKLLASLTVRRLGFSTHLKKANLRVIFNEFSRKRFTFKQNHPYPAFLFIIPARNSHIHELS
jgi:hypothetical protein